MLKDLVCIVCPRGCHLKVDVDNDYKVSGNLCPRGESYGVKELTNPTRVITSTVKIDGGIHKRIPVKTNGDIPKDLNYECIKIINSITLKSPIKMGDVIVENILGTGVNLVASRDM